MIRLVRILARLAKHDEVQLHTSVPQLAKAMGFDVRGMNVREVKDRYGKQIKLTLGYLEKAGWVANWAASWEGRESDGILVTLAPGAATAARRSSSVGRTTRSRGDAGCTPREGGGRSLPPGGRSPFFSTESSSPPTTSTVKRRLLQVPHGGGRAQSALSTRDRAHLSTIVGAALARRLQEVDDEGGAATVEALPWLASVPVDIVAREAARLELAAGRLRLRRGLSLSAKWQRNLEVAAAQIDRHALAGPSSSGKGVALILDLIRGDWRELSPRNSPPRSLGAFAVLTRRLARRWRRHARARAASTLAGGAAHA